MSIEVKIEEFKVALTKHSSLDFVRNIMLPNESYILGREKEQYLFEDIAGFFEVDINDIFMVGSAKLGFSIKPGNRFRHFGDESDVDVVLVNSELFERVWKEVYKYVQSGEYWEKEREFNYYLSKGWIRPDKLPRARAFEFTKRWWEYFREATYSEKFGRYKIRGALYFNQFFFESYQRICIEQLKQEAL